VATSAEVSGTLPGGTQATPRNALLQVLRNGAPPDSTVSDPALDSPALSVDGKSPPGYTEGATGDAGEIADGTGFTYKQNPMDNPKSAKDILKNPNAVYGYSPNPLSERIGRFAEFDWTDKDIVARAREARLQYHKDNESMYNIVKGMQQNGLTVEEIARAANQQRNVNRLQSYIDTGNMSGYEKAVESNMRIFHNKFGMTADQAFAKYGSWDIVLAKAMSANAGMDACCGLYDDFYYLYSMGR